MNIFKILGDCDKLAIIYILMDGEECVCNLESLTGLKQTTISNKLKVLRENNILDMRRDKNWNYYSINPEFQKDNQQLLAYIKEKINPEQLFNPTAKRTCNI